MLNVVVEADAKGVALRAIDPEVVTAGDLGRMVLKVLGMVTAMELKFIRDRQSAGRGGEGQGGLQGTSETRR